MELARRSRWEKKKKKIRYTLSIWTTRCTNESDGQDRAGRCPRTRAPLVGKAASSSLKPDMINRHADLRVFVFVSVCLFVCWERRVWVARWSLEEADCGVFSGRKTTLNSPWMQMSDVQMRGKEEEGFEGNACVFLCLCHSYPSGGIEGSGAEQYNEGKKNTREQADARIWPCQFSGKPPTGIIKSNKKINPTHLSSLSSLATPSLLACLLLDWWGYPPRREGGLRMCCAYLIVAHYRKAPLDPLASCRTAPSSLSHVTNVWRKKRRRKGKKEGSLMCGSGL